MSALGLLLRLTDGNRIAFWCPGCDEAHALYVTDSTPGGGRGWSWNGDIVAPIFSPSVLVRSGHFAEHFKAGDECWCTYDAAHPDEPSGFKCGRCHSFVEAGCIRFLSDSSHALSGQTVALPPFPFSPD